MRRAIVRSRSSRKSGFVGARGASCEEAKVRAGVMSAFGVAMHLRISSMSWSRRRAKWREGSRSRIWIFGTMISLGMQHFGVHKFSYLVVGHTED